METSIRNPLVIRCNNCGGDQSYDIVKQKYCCAHCGSEADITEKKAEYRRWKHMRHDTVMRDIAKVKSFSCPTCGAQTFAEGENATATCPFCQNTMIDAEFAGNDLPEVIIPFKLTQEEAENKLREWLKNNSGDPAAQVIEKSLPHLTGCYLPYHIVRGAINSSLQIRLHDDTVSDYPFRAYLSHTVVNASKDLDNLFLNGIEPFNFDETLAFDFGYLNHQNAKVQNVTNEELNARVDEETRAELYESLTKKSGTKELSIRLDDNENESIPALMPVYFVKGGNGIAAAVNGQTGKVAVATGKTKDLTRFWWIVPTIATIIITLAISIFGDLEHGPWIGLGLGVIFYAIARGRHKKEIVNEVLTWPDTGNTHNDTRAEFFTDFGEGPVPAKLRFFTPWRIVKSVLVVLVAIALPALIAIPIQLLRGLPLTDIHLAYGAGWYFIFGFVAILSLGGLAKAMMYSAPIYQEILPDGMQEKRKPKSKKVSLLSSFWANYKATLSTKSGVLFTIFMVLLLCGSVLFMVY